jgi:glycosyltransferase involved in cell wall biosynthesis
MRVLINQLTAVRGRTGIGHYADRLVRGLRALSHSDQFLTYPPAWVEQSLRRLCRAKGNGAGVAPARAVALRPAQIPVCLQSWLNRLGRSAASWHFRLHWSGQDIDLYHEPNYIPLPCDRPTIATVHDLSLLLHPEWHPAERAAYYQRHFHKGLARCAHFLAISDSGRRELIRTLNLPANRVTRTYLGVRADLRPLPREETAQVLGRLGLPDRYLLCVGTLEPRKNLLLLLRAYCSLPDNLRTRCPLLVVGGWGWNTAELAEYLQAEARHRGVRHLGYVRDEDLAAVYNGARALVFPSLYEGLGLPPLEMMACGGAVIASTAAAVVETVGARAWLIDPYDVDGWRAALARAITDDDWLQTLRRGVTEVARPFTWERCAAETLQVYRAVGGLQNEPLRRAA